MEEEITTTLDPERQKRAKEYARINRRLMLVDMAFGGLYALLWLFLGWSEALKQALLGWTTNAWLLVIAYAAVFGGIYFLIDLPLTYYEGFVLPHRFEISNQTLRGWVSDQVKGLLLGSVLGGLLLEIIYVVLRLYPDTWWLWAAGILLLFSVILANLAPVLLMPIFYKFVPLGDEYADLKARLVRLAENAGTHVRGVYKFDMSRRTKAANAALTGLGNTRRIILGDTLLNEFSNDEIETVLAHELGHQVHKDIPIGMVVETVTTLVGLYLANLALHWGVSYFGFDGVGDIAAFPIFLLVLGLYGLVTMPLSNAFSRWRERRADEYALESTHKPQAFASAMTRLANQNLSDVDPEPWVEFLLYSHPALQKRIAMAESRMPREGAI
jgi:STE24 endopeptidase